MVNSRICSNTFLSKSVIFSGVSPALFKVSLLEKLIFELFFSIFLTFNGRCDP